jgi:hypothetical protein
VKIGGQGLTAVGVVMGQGNGSDTSLILAAAGEAAQQLVESLVRAIGMSTMAHPPRPRPPYGAGRA